MSTADSTPRANTEPDQGSEEAGSSTSPSSAHSDSDPNSECFAEPLDTETSGDPKPDTWRPRTGTRKESPVKPSSNKRAKPPRRPQSRGARRKKSSASSASPRRASREAGKAKSKPRRGGTPDRRFGRQEQGPGQEPAPGGFGPVPSGVWGPQVGAQPHAAGVSHAAGATGRWAHVFALYRNGSWELVRVLCNHELKFMSGPDDLQRHIADVLGGGSYWVTVFAPEGILFHAQLEAIGTRSDPSGRYDPSPKSLSERVVSDLLEERVQARGGGTHAEDLHTLRRTIEKALPFAADLPYDYLLDLACDWWKQLETARRHERSPFELEGDRTQGPAEGTPPSGRRARVANRQVSAEESLAASGRQADPQIRYRPVNGGIDPMALLPSQTSLDPMDLLRPSRWEGWGLEVPCF